MCVVQFLEEAADLVYTTVGGNPPESGCILGGRGELISRAWFDEGAGTGKPVYQPSAAAIEEVVRGWQREGYQFLGLVHSHGLEYPCLSPSDLRSAQLIMRANRMDSILLGLFCSGKLRMYRAWSAEDGWRGRLEELEVQIVSSETVPR